MYIYLSIMKHIDLSDARSWIAAASAQFEAVRGVAAPSSGVLDRGLRLIRLRALAVTPAALREMARLDWVSSVSMTAGACSLCAIVAREEDGDGAALIAAEWLDELRDGALSGALDDVDAQATREALYCVAQWGDAEDTSIVDELAVAMAERIRDLMSEADCSW